MKASSVEEVRELYDETADSYATMMDAEIDLPLYRSVLGRLNTQLQGVPGVLVDTSCGSGHMLAMYHQQYDQQRALLGVDLSERMVDIAAIRLREAATVCVGDGAGGLPPCVIIA